MRKTICLILALFLLVHPAFANPMLFAPMPAASAPSQGVANQDNTRKVGDIGATVYDVGQLAFNPNLDKLYSNAAKSLKNTNASMAKYYTSLAYNVGSFGLAGLEESGFDYLEGKITKDQFQQTVGGAALLYAGGAAAARYGGGTPTFNNWAGQIKSALSPAGNISAQSTVTVYRVEGEPNTRIILGDNGEVTIQGGKTLFLNFGDKPRAEAFLRQKIDQGMPGATVKSFQVPKSTLDNLQNSAIPEYLGRKIPNSPIKVDTTKAPNQFGLREPQIRDLELSIIQGTGKEGF